MVFLTGSSGLVGSHVLTELLKNGEKVRALKRPHSNLEQTNKIITRRLREQNIPFQEIEWVDGDICDVHGICEHLENISEVYHCAGLVSFNPADKEKIFQTNATGTENLVNASLEKGVKKFCHVSSVAALGSTADPITEETYWKSSPANSFYSISKYAAEREVWRGIEEGLNAVIVNPSIVIGPGHWNTGSSNLFFRAQKGMWFYTTGSSGFVDARDLAEVMLGLMKKNAFGKRFIVSSENMPYKELFETLCSSMGKPIPYLKAGKMLGMWACQVEKIRSKLMHVNPLLTVETARAAHLRKNYSNIKIKKELGCTFIPVRQSLLETSRLFQSDLLSV